MINIGKYRYTHYTEEDVDVYYDTEGNSTLIAMFKKIGNNITMQINIVNPDFIEIYSNAVKLFNGEIILEENEL